MQTSSCVRALGLASVLALVSGCTSFGPYHVRISLDESMAAGAKSAVVDLVGVNAIQRGNPAVRESGVQKTLEFGAGKATSQTLLRTDEKWQVWKSRGARHLMLFGDLPDGRASIELPLSSKAWPKPVVNGKEPLELIIHQNHIECATPSKPLK